MPHQTLKIVPGVDENRTMALNEAALSYSNLIRFIPDRQGIGLPQKLGGWTRFFPNSVGAIPRSLLAWEDTNHVKRLAVGCETVSPSVGAPLYVIADNNLNNITPQNKENNPTVSITTVAGSNLILVNDPASNITSYDSVYFVTQISVGGLILSGFYQCHQVGANSYNIYATDVLGYPQNATSSVTNGGAVSMFTTTSGSNSVTVTLNNHGLAVGDTYTVLVPTTIGGITFSGEYTVVTVPTANTFTIYAKNGATSSTSGYMNGGNAQYRYYYGYGPLPVGTGYGVGGYGAGGYGSGVPPISGSGSNIQASDWTLDNWGEVLIACPYNVTPSTDPSNPGGGAIYSWSPSLNQPIATPIIEAPSSNNGVLVAMPQRQIIAWGSTFDGNQDPLLLRWCDVENYSVWAAQPANQAGSYRLSKGSRIVSCIQGPQQTLIWTDLAVWSMQYVGQPNIYQFNEIGTGCGLISRKAATSLSGVAYWMGQSQFYTLGNGSVQVIPCPVWDVIFQDLDTDNLDKIRVAPNSRFNEISWYYPTKSNGGEINAYVKYNVSLNQWDFGTLSRTAWINQSVLGAPIGSSPTGLIYQHETSNDADGQPMNSSFQTGYFTLADGDVMTYVDQFWPDAKWGYYDGVNSANIQITFYVANYPGDTPAIYGPYTITQATTYITPRFRGRLVSIKIASNDAGSFWRLGAMRYRYSPDGKF
jgi:hypothetical protein